MGLYRAGYGSKEPGYEYHSQILVKKPDRGIRSRIGVYKASIRVYKSGYESTEPGYGSIEHRYGFIKLEYGSIV